MQRVIFIFLFFSLFLYSVEIDDRSKYHKEFSIAYVEDREGNHSIESIQNVNFQRRLLSRFSLGYKDPKSHHWFKFSITNRGKDDTQILYFNNLFAHSFTFYYQKENRWYSQEEGALSKREQKGIEDRNPRLSLHINSNETQTIYIKMQSDFAIVGEFLLFANEKELLSYSNYYLLGLIFFFGALLFVIALNLFLFVTLRLKLYGYYVGYLLFFGVFLITVNGLYNNIGWVGWVQPLHSLVPLSLLFFALFSSALLELKKHTPKIVLLLNIVIVILFVLALLINISITPWYMITNAISSLVFVLLLIATIIGVIKGVQKAKVYLVILIVHIITLAMMSNMYDGRLANNDFNQYSFMLVSLFEFIFFTLILANKINEESAKKRRVEEQKKVFETLFYDTSDGVFLVSNGKFIDCNDAIVTMFAYGSKEEIVGLHPSKLSPKHQPNGNLSYEDANAWIKKSLDTGALQFEWLHQRATGETFWSEIVLTKLEINDESIIHAVCRDIQSRKQLEIDNQTKTQEIKRLYHNLQDSIDYASLIQNSIVPESKLFKKYFDAYFVFWEPKDVVGGDIYLFEELRNDNECLMMIIDCTGHGVPGAFVTMLVKAIEREIIGTINRSTEDVSPAWILQHFNQTMKKLLKQENRDSISNSGFDGGIVYINKKRKVVKFAGANTPFIYIQKGQTKLIKGDRHSIGYQTSQEDYQFTDHTLSLDTTLQGYLVTDGYLDQMGGKHDFLFGKKRLLKMISETKDKSFEEQKSHFIESLKRYQNGYERKDDITLLGFKLEGLK